MIENQGETDKVSGEYNYSGVVVILSDTERIVTFFVCRVRRKRAPAWEISFSFVS
jgi:hypothetical protein